MPRFALVLAAVVLGARVPAQSELEARLQRLRARLADVRAQQQELSGLLEMHQRGDAIGKTRWLEVTDVDRARAENAGEDGVSAADARTVALRKELAALDAAVADARIRAEDRAMGDALPRPEELARLRDRARNAGAEPASGPAPKTGGVDAIDPIRIRGTLDHARVGCALLEAGAELLREAQDLEDRGRGEAAESKRAEARVRLDAARTELERVTSTLGTRAPLVAVFSLARVEEKLGRPGVADALYAEVMARDQRPATDGRSEYGPFGRAARTARAVMEWLRDTSDWQPRRDVDRIRWDDR